MPLIEVLFVEQDGVTIADAWLENQRSPEPAASAVARKDPQDKDDLEIGRMLAAGRALEKLGKRMQKQANGLVKHRDDMRQDQAKKRGNVEQWAKRRAEAERNATLAEKVTNAIYDSMNYPSVDGITITDEEYDLIEASRRADPRLFEFSDAELVGSIRLIQDLGGRIDVTTKEATVRFKP